MLLTSTAKFIRALTVTGVFTGLAFFSMNALALRDLPDLPKYPDDLKEATWDANKDKAVSVIAAAAKVKGLGTEMKGAEEARAELNFSKYQIDNADLVKLDEVKIHQIHQANKSLWAAAQSKVVAHMKAINKIANDYKKAISASKLEATVSKKFNTYLEAVITSSNTYEQKVAAMDANEAFAIVVERQLDARDMASGKKYLRQIAENLTTISSLQSKVKTKTDWATNNMQSQHIRSTFIAANQLKARVGDGLVGQWRTASQDGWQPTNDAEVITKYVELMKLVADTQKALGE